MLNIFFKTTYVKNISMHSMLVRSKQRLFYITMFLKIFKTGVFIQHIILFNKTNGFTLYKS